MIPLANHLWQSTIFAAAAMLLTLALRKNRAQTRYWIWLVASLKFLLPFSMLVSVGSQFEWRNVPAVAPVVSVAVEQLSQPFEPLALPAPAATAFPVVPALLVTVWLCGCAGVLVVWRRRWRRIRTAVRAGSPLPLDAPIRVLSSPTLIEPGVFGVFRPVLLLPADISERLTPAQLQAILAHELCHVRRRDNLAAAIHMVVETIFWFHPLVWWIGTRLVEERERACDEEVLRSGSKPQVYAEGIVNVCRFYVESPLPCASGVTGADLKKRIEAIMTNRASRRLTLAGRLAIVAVGIAALAGPILLGVIKAGQAAEILKFDVASIRPSNRDTQNSQLGPAPGGGMRATNISLKQLVCFAYDVRDFQVSGGPGWLGSARFDVLAKTEGADSMPDPKRVSFEQMMSAMNQHRMRMRALLAERFQLAIHRDTKELPVYALQVSKSGSKLTETKSQNRHLRNARGEMRGDGASVLMLANGLSNALGRTVIDETGLKGYFDFEMSWTPELGGTLPGDPSDRPEAPGGAGPSLFTAIQEQLGLRLESKKGPVEIIVVDRAEKPSEN